MGQAAEKYVRQVGGNLVSSVITDTPAMRIEVLRRQTAGRMHWHFRQPELSLFWFAKGAMRLKATIDGRAVDRSFPGKSQLAIFPAAVEIEGEWDVGPTLDYTVIFLNPDFVGQRLQNAITDSTVAFQHEGLTRSLTELCREVASPDSVFDLLSEGWAMQALAHISRVSNRPEETRAEHRANLSRRCLRQIDEYVRDNLSGSISIAQLASVAGLSTRHFLRAFQDSVGVTPYSFVMDARIDDAKRRLAHTNESVTDIALATGFGHAQHFATRFKKSTGLTPSSYRQKKVA